ncbi:folate-binding protein [Aquincola sp. MAHUQ-54]|uniref:Folate-binding protein n=1 Tax=Aquincola agrisoli TaxID=3119538 RepID=A0AAW9QLC0_9BURK
MDTTLSPPDANGAVALPHWGVIRAAGPDAAAFLNSQLTQDVAQLAAGQARLAGYCSAKGRLLASFVVWRNQADELLLACSADLLPATLKRLSMFVLRAKCKLTDASAELAVHGLAGASAAESLGAAWPAAAWAVTAHGPADVLRLPDVDGTPRALWVGPPGAAQPALPALAASVWDALEVRSGVPRIVAATVEQFVPQMVNLELVGGVSFQKGCYPGQEIVARSQYRGTLKRRAALFSLGSPAEPGQEVFDAKDPGQPAGMVVNGSMAGDTALALVEVKLAALADADLHLGSPQGPALHKQALPYAFPAVSD